MRLFRQWLVVRAFGVFLATCGMFIVMSIAGLAGAIPVPNGSFETPTTVFVAVDFDSWQKTPKPDWFEETDDDKWTFKVGTFVNTNATSPDHLDNIDGKNALFLFSVPDVGLFQDYDSVDYNDPAPTHAFNATFEPGKFYSLTVGICGLGGGMPFGATMEVSLYYRDALGNRVPIATTTIVHSADVFLNHTHFVDFHVKVPTVLPTDAWAGKHIGIQFLSTVPNEEDKIGGYWDIDNIRLGSGPDPIVLTRDPTNARASLYSLSSYKYQWQSSDNLVDWANEGNPLPGTDGPLSFVQPFASYPRRFFRTLVTALP